MSLRTEYLYTLQFVLLNIFFVMLVPDLNWYEFVINILFESWNSLPSMLKDSAFSQLYIKICRKLCMGKI